MKHFILEGKHLAPFEQFANLEPRHHEFLQQGYDSGAFLFSGPQAPPHGGFLSARAQSREQLDAFLAEEPFVKGGFMRFINVMQFDPVQHQPFLKEWFAGAPVAHRQSVSNAGQPAASHDWKSRTKYFLLEGAHLVPLEQRDPALTTAHRTFLEEGYRMGDFLMSGPTIPPKGGLLVARAASLNELNDKLAGEPYQQANVMRFKRITEFIPLQRQAFLNEWFDGKGDDRQSQSQVA